MSSFLSLPTFGTNIIEKEITSKVWYFFFQGLWKGQPPSSEVNVIVGASPYSYEATNQKGFVVISGGTVSDISISRDNVTFYTTGETTGVFPMSVSDHLRVTYTVLPVMTFFPQ